MTTLPWMLLPVRRELTFAASSAMISALTALLPPKVAEALAVVVVKRLEAWIEDQRDPGPNRVGREQAVLAAVALGEAERERARDEHAVGRDELHPAR